MLGEEITELREKLDNSIKNGVNYNIIYKISVELDELIAKYYTKSIGVYSVRTNK